MIRDLGVLILAAGGKRRRRAGEPAAFHSVLGKPLLEIAADAVSGLHPAKIAVAVSGPPRDISRLVGRKNLHIVRIQEGVGIADAILAARKAFSPAEHKDLIILDSGLPLITPRTLKALLGRHRTDGNFLTFLHDQQKRDVGVCIGSTGVLFRALTRIAPPRTDVFPLAGLIEFMFLAGKKTGAFEAPDAREVFRVESLRDLSLLAALFRERKNRELAAKGVMVMDPASVWVDLGVEIGRGTVLFPSVIIEGESRVGRDCRILPFSHISESKIGHRVVVRGSTVLDGCALENDVQVGPFARIRPGTVVRRGAHVGNFVEMKKTDFGRKAKAGHLSYLGDSFIGEAANIGAGTITCNYDGVKKNSTWIGPGAFIGSGTELVAPVKVGRGAYVGAGSTITKDVSPHALAIARGRQFEKAGWAKRRRK